MRARSISLLTYQFSTFKLSNSLFEQGDSGSPAVEYQEDVAIQIGIVSYGSTCAGQSTSKQRVNLFLSQIDG